MKPSSVRTSTKGGNTALKRYKALKHVILMSDGDHQDRPECAGGDFTALCPNWRT
ncbi:hypothetical protein HMPREF9997_01840 [Corynebacterium durum F0235]|uniref:Uncharacterized protein n=1 Tax=Corynebacterium durum F0235 TaxID=1035195 RepID=L1MEJ8_9CORY|nr:hypothetical protein HMPREF9997_01840 [Corynebacterium durum F0235]